MSHRSIPDPGGLIRFGSRRAYPIGGALKGFALLILVAAGLGFIASATANDEELAHQPKSEYRARRQKLMEQVKDGIVVLIGAREDEFGEVGRFRQKNDFMYLSGVETPSAYLMLVPAGLIPGKSAEEVAFIPPRNLFQERWTGVQIGPGPEAEQKFGLQEVAGADKFYARLFDILSSPPFAGNGPRGQNSAKLYTLLPKGSIAQLTRERQFVDLIHSAAPQVQVADVEPYLAEMRKIKSPVEAGLLQKAVDISAEGQREACLKIRPNVFEYELQAILEAAFIRNGAARPGYPSIVASGINSTVLHYNQNRRRIETGETVVIDGGAEYSYYTADITRTYPATGKFTPRQREVYQLVLGAQRAAEKAFSVGETTMSDLHAVAIAAMKASPLRDKHGNTLDKYFIHGLSHWLGMDVHDVGDSSKPIPVGAVITIEPGIYIPEEGFGVRVEDDYLITDRGLLKMSAGIPSEADDIERLMSSRVSAIADQTEPCLRSGHRRSLSE
jgi:Xaa-Pro aminopeptidase